jgi:predicted nucleic acid-binding protein
MRVDSYLDTSFLIKPYVFEPESDVVSDWIRRNHGSLFISALSDVEIVTSLHRTFVDSRVAVTRSIDNYRGDLTNGVFRRLEMDSAVFEMATNIAERYTALYKLRSLDVLHLAIATRYKIASFGTYDKRLAAAAEGLGLTLAAPRS